MTVIQSCQLNDPETFGQGDETRIGSTKRQVRILLHQFGARSRSAEVRSATVKKPVANERRNSASIVEPASRARRQDTFAMTNPGTSRGGLAVTNAAIDAS
jgi:hypothetical protein